MPRKYSLRNMRKEYRNFADRDFYNHGGSRQRLTWLRFRFARPVFDSLILPLAGLFCIVRTL